MVNQFFLTHDTKILLLAAGIQLFCMSPLLAQFDSVSSEEWTYLAKNSLITLVGDTNFADPGAQVFPLIEVTLEYKGQKDITINWDENFGNILWEGYFVLESSAPGFKENSSQLKMRTSDVYYPEKSVTLKKDMTLGSTLDFSKLPAKYLQHLFGSKKKVTLQLYLMIEDKPVPVGNELVFRIK